MIVWKENDACHEHGGQIIEKQMREIGRTLSGKAARAAMTKTATWNWQTVAGAAGANQHWYLTLLECRVLGQEAAL